MQKHKKICIDWLMFNVSLSVFQLYRGVNGKRETSNVVSFFLQGIQWLITMETNFPQKTRTWTKIVEIVQRSLKVPGGIQAVTVPT